MLSRIIKPLVIFFLSVLLVVYVVLNFSVFWPKIRLLIDSGSSNTTKIVHVIDGDSILVLDNDELIEVRMIGFDAPELSINGEKEQCFAQDAVAKLNAYFETERSIELVADEQVGDVDEFDRKLRYVLLSDGKDIAKDMISGGFGKEMTVQPYEKNEEYKASQKYAEDSKSGIWADASC